MAAKCALLFAFVSILLFAPVFQSIAQTDSVIVERSYYIASQNDTASLIKNRFGRNFINGRKLSISEVSDRLSCADTAAFRQYTRNHRLRNIAFAPLVVGGATGLIGFFVFVDGVVDSFTRDGRRKRHTGFALICVGDGLMLTSVGMFVASKLGKNKAVRRYNRSIANPGTSLYIRPAATGLALGFRF